MLQLEFTVEPFVEGQPGPHVTAAVTAAEAAGGNVDFGPFGSSCSASAEAMPSVIAELVRAAFANGASHITMHVTTGNLTTRHDETGHDETGHDES